jgi:uncharacterized membrane protein YesL
MFTRGEHDNVINFVTNLVTSISDLILVNNSRLHFLHVSCTACCCFRVVTEGTLTVVFLLLQHPSLYITTSPCTFSYVLVWRSSPAMAEVIYRAYHV